jgi:hypothetical protein
MNAVRTSMKTGGWSIMTALQLIRNIEPECRKFGYFLGLAGGVLRTGHSENDLDIMVMPLNLNPDPEKVLHDLTGMLEMLADIWGHYELYAPRVIDHSEYSTGYIRNVDTYLVQYKHMKIDLFIHSQG